MNAIIDKRLNLSRGFADLHTPSEVENELVYSWQEKKQDLIKKIEMLSVLIKEEKDEANKKTLLNQRKQAQESLVSLGIKIQKRVSLSLLIIDRFKQICSKDEFEMICALARQDKSRILSNLSINDA